MTNAQRSTLALFALSMLASACALPRDEGALFRERLEQSGGQLIQRLIDELGPVEVQGDGSHLRYEWGVISIGGGEWTIEVTTDDHGRIVASSMTGSDYTCGSMILSLRRNEARYRRNPGLREREEAEMKARLEELVRLRRLFRRDPQP